MINRSTSSSHTKPLITAGLILSCLVFISTLVTSFGAFLPARVAAGLPFRITNVGSSDTPTLVINQENTIEWDTRPENVTQYPAEAISLCPTNSVTLTPDCHVLDFYTENDGSATVFVPPTFSPGNYNLIFTAWNSSTRLVFEVNNTVQVQLLGFIAPTATPEPTTQITQQQTQTSQASPTPILSPTPLTSPSPLISPTVTNNASLQLIILNNQPITDPFIHFTLGNIDSSTIDCVTVNVNDQEASFRSPLPTC